MKVECRHGYFIFRERESGDISRFNSLYGMKIAPKYDYFTFPLLVDAPEHSFVGKTYLNLDARALYAGRPWDVMAANRFIYDFTQGELKKIELVTVKPTIQKSQFFFVSTGLILPGSYYNGKQIVDYDAVYSFGSSRFRYSKLVTAT